MHTLKAIFRLNRVIIDSQEGLLREVYWCSEIKRAFSKSCMHAVLVSGKRKSFPRGYFLKNSEVEHRAVVCFRYLCENVLCLDREGICKTFCNSYAIKVLSKYKLKMLVDMVYESLFHLVLAAYPDYAGDLENYRLDKRRSENKEAK